MEKIDRQYIDQMPDLDSLADIPVPEGLSVRLSQRIDLWSEVEHLQRIKVSGSRTKPFNKARIWRNVAIAASVAALLGLGLFWFRPTSKGQIDTYDDPQLAYEETVKALSILSESMTLCQDEMLKVDDIQRNTASIISSTLNFTE